MVRFKELVTFSSIFIFLSCSQEKQALNTFFDAVQSGDEAARAAVSAVDMPVKVQSWEIIEEGVASTEPFRFPEVQRKVVDAKREVDYHAEKMGIFLNDYKSIHERYKAQLEKDPDAELKGDLAEHHQKWEELLQQEKDLAAALEQANQEMEMERHAAGISLMGTTVSDNLDGEVAVKEFSINVTSEEGENPYRFTLKKYDLTDTQTQSRARSRWIITNIQEHGA